jgi:hypothetical protein
VETYESVQPAVEPAKLIAPVFVRFMATDRAFAKLRRVTRASPTAKDFCAWMDLDYPQLSARHNLRHSA